MGNTNTGRRRLPVVDPSRPPFPTLKDVNANTSRPRPSLTNQDANTPSSSSSSDANAHTGEENTGRRRLPVVDPNRPPFPTLKDVNANTSRPRPSLTNQDANTPSSSSSSDANAHT